MEYWNQNGKYQKENELFMDKLVPATRMEDCNTEEGELCRGANGFFYDLYNNGLGNLDGQKNLFKYFAQSALTLDLSKEAKEYAKDIESLIELTEEAEGLNEEETSEETCYDCSGDGEDYEGNTCSACGGSGVVEEDIMSEKDECIEFRIKPLIEKLKKNDTGATKLMDDVLKYIISTEVGQEVLRKSKTLSV